MAQESYIELYHGQTVLYGSIPSVNTVPNNDSISEKKLVTFIVFKD